MAAVEQGDVQPLLEGLDTAGHGRLTTVAQHGGAGERSRFGDRDQILYPGRFDDRVPAGPAAAPGDSGLCGLRNALEKNRAGSPVLMHVVFIALKLSHTKSPQFVRVRSRFSMLQLSKYSRIRYGHFPTPLEFMPNLTRHLGGPNLYIK